MGEGRQRNDPCWCGSGKKYKRCHLDRDQEAKIQPWEADQGLRQTYGRQRCMVPDTMRDTCSGDIVRAHTVPKSGSLSRIAKDGHVCAFKTSVQSIARVDGLLQPEPVGVNRASTFTGFCSTHDKDLFARVEDAPVTFSQEQCFLFGYRAMARETFLKEAQAESTGLVRMSDRGRSLDDQVAIQAVISAMGIGADAGLKDAVRHKGFYDEVLTSGDYSGVMAYVVTFDRFPSVMCSAGLFPYESFDGSNVQDFANLTRPADAIYYTSFAADDIGAVVFTWLPDSDKTCRRFIETLEHVGDSQLTNTLVRFFFEFCENVQISPDWWDSLGGDVQMALRKRISAAGNVMVARSPGCLLDDGVHYDEWGVRRRFWVGLSSSLKCNA